MEWTTEKPADPIELRIYPGADGDFTLYEDENDSYRYEKGVHATIALHWDDAEKTLTVGAREGSFPGMLAERTFRVVLVGKDHGAGIGESPTADASVVYKGAKTTSSF
jgi:alpha-D-xyloside xylohydrolase